MSAASNQQAKNWFKPGVGGNPTGRPKGKPNKFSSDIKQMVLTALNDVGGAQYLARQAEKNPVAFMGLIGKVLPLQIAGADGGALVIDFRWADATPVATAVIEGEAVSTNVIDTQPDSKQVEITWDSSESNDIGEC